MNERRQITLWEACSPTVVQSARSGTSGAGIVIARASEIVSLRMAYEKAVRDLSGQVDKMRVEGRSVEEIARTMSEARRRLGIEYKDMTPPRLRKKIYERNLVKYGNIDGPTIDYLRAQGKGWDQIIESAGRPSGIDMVSKVFGWLFMRERPLRLSPRLFCTSSGGSAYRKDCSSAGTYRLTNKFRGHALTGAGTGGRA